MFFLPSSRGIGWLPIPPAAALATLQIFKLLVRKRLADVLGL